MYEQRSETSDDDAHLGGIIGDTLRAGHRSPHTPHGHTGDADLTYLSRISDRASGSRA